MVEDLIEKVKDKPMLVTIVVSAVIFVLLWLPAFLMTRIHDDTMYWWTTALAAGMALYIGYSFAKDIQNKE